MKVRSVFKLGESVAITLPKETGLKRGDSVAVSVEDDKIIVKKVILPK